LGRFFLRARQSVLEPGDLEADGTLGVINGSYILEIAAEGDSEGQRDRGKFAWVFGNFKVDGSFSSRFGRATFLRKFRVSQKKKRK